MEAVLEVRGLGKRYEGFSLEGLSFEVPRGHVVGLIGPNGAGKTTTLKLILGLLNRSSGEIRAFGIDPAADGAGVRARVGFVHDEPVFYRHLSLAGNASLVARFYASWDAAAFRRHSAAFGLPLGKRFGALSRGTKTKFALAVALSHRAELLLLDEPTSGLDPVFRRELLDTLMEMIEDGRTSILFSTHITSDLERIADFITLLQEGRLVLSAPKDEILEGWALVKGGPEVLERLPESAVRGVRHGVHGIEALTDNAALARGRLGESAVIDRASLEDVVFFTTGNRGDA